MSKEIEQRTDEWFNQRLGRFTASRIDELMGVKGLGLTGEDYAFQNACEVVFGRNEEESFTSFDMQRGIQLEPLALAKFNEVNQFNFIKAEVASFFPFGEHAGASPDGLIGSDAILEIKCPRPNKFFKIVEKGFSAIDRLYINQMQMQMLCTNSQRCHFFNYIIYNGVEMWHELIIERDEAIIDKIKERIDIAVELKLQFIESLKTNIQFELN
jgi:putative phage-type endonuclease